VRNYRERGEIECLWLGVDTLLHKNLKDE